MNWIYLNVFFIVLTLLTPCFGAAEDGGQSSFHDAEEMLPLEQKVDPQDIAAVQKMSSHQPGRRHFKQFYTPNFNRNLLGNSGIQMVRKLIQGIDAPLVGQPLDAQASTGSKQMVLVLNNDKNKYSDLTKPPEESTKRLPRNPDVMDDFVGQFQQLGTDMTQQFLQKFSKSAPDMSQTLGKAADQLFTRANLLAQVPSGSLDLGQFGQSITTKFLGSAAPNAFSQQVGQAAPAALSSEAASTAEETGVEAPAETETVGSAADSETAQAPEANDASKTTKNTFEGLLGQNLLSRLPSIPSLPSMPSLPLSPINPLGMLGLGQIMGLGSEISEVRVLPEHYSPYKVSPKQADHQTINEMKLKAVLKDALTKKTIPILWFHLPAKHNVQKTDEELEMDAKLENFEQKVIAELKQLQELAKMANEIKRTQLQSGFQPTPSLITKLNLFEIPVYDITLADIERTLKDEHVIMLMQTLVQKQKDFQRHQEATTKYLTDLTGAPIKRQISNAEDTLKNMEKDDMLKMMTYAYRMAALNGHEMPWINKKVSKFYETETSQPMGGERQWLEEKQQQMSTETEKQKEMMPPQMQQPMPMPMPMQNQMFDMNMAMQQREMMQQQTMNNLNMPQQMSMNHMPRQRFDTNNPDVKNTTKEEKSEQKQSIENKMNEQTNGMNTKKIVTPTDQLTEQRQQRVDENIANKNMRMDTVPTVGEAKPQMAENSGKARHKGIEDLFDGMDLFHHLKGKTKEIPRPPTVVNYYYNSGGSRYQPNYPSPPSYIPSGGYSGGYVHRPPPPPQYKPMPNHYGTAAHGSNAYAYRTATGDEEIAAMLQEQQKSMPVTFFRK